MELNYEELRSIVANEQFGPDEGEEITYDATAGELVSTTLKATVRSLVSSATFGSIDPFAEELDNPYTTAGLVYATHKDAIDAASFIGGAFVPGLGVAKFLKYARAGTMGLVGKPVQLAHASRTKAYRNVLETAKDQGIKSSEFREARKALRNKTMLAEFTDNMYYEAGIAYMMNNHAYFEDGYDVSDAAVGVALGAAFSPVAWWVVRSRANKAIQKETSKQFKKIEDALPAAAATEDIGDAMAITASILKTGNQIQSGELKVAEHVKHTLDEGIAENTKRLRKYAEDLFTAGGTPVKRPQEYSSDLGIMDYTYKEYDPASHLMRIAYKNPRALKGVYAAEQVTANTAIHSGQDILQHSSAGYTISSVKDFFRRSFNADIFRADIKKARKVLGQYGIKTTPKDGVVEVKLKRATHLNDRVMRAIAVVNRSSALPIKITFEKGKAKDAKTYINKVMKRLSEANESSFDLELSNRLPMRQLAEEFKASPARAAISPFFRDEVLSELEFVASAGAADVKEARDRIVKGFAPVASWKRELREAIENPASLNAGTADADAAYIQALYTARRTNVPKEGFLEVTEEEVRNAAYLQALYFRGAEKVKFGNKIIDVHEKVRELKVNAIQELTKEGYTLEQVARYVNLRVEDVENILVAGKWTPDMDIELGVYDSTSQIAKYLDAKATILTGRIESTPLLDEALEQGALDRQTVQALHMEHVQTTLIRHYKVKGVKELLALSDSSIAKELRQGLSKVLGTPTAISTMTSLDHSMRILDSLRDHAVRIGQDIEQLENEVSKYYLSKVKQLFRPIVEDQSLVIQFNLVKQALDSVPAEKAPFLRLDGDTILVSKPNAEVPEHLTYRHSPAEVIKLQEPLVEFFEQWEKVQDEIFALQNAARDARGLPPLERRGIWLPYEDVENKHIAYVQSKYNPRDVQIVTAANKAELDETLSSMRKDPKYRNFLVITRDSNEKRWLEINRAASLNRLKMADVSMKKAGVSNLQVSADTGTINAMLRTLNKQVRGLIGTMHEVAFQPELDTLRFYDQLWNEAANSSRKTLWNRSQVEVSPAAAVAKALTNQTLMQQGGIFQSIDDGVSAAIGQGLERAKKLIDIARKGGDEDYEKLAEKLEKEGIPTPFRSAIEYRLALDNISDPLITKKVIQRGNGLLVNLAIRWAELGHAAVTMLSTPVILASEVKGIKAPMDVLMAAAKAMNDPAMQQVRELAKERGYSTMRVAEINEFLKNLSVDIIEDSKWKAVDSFVSKPTEWAETVTREYAFFVGLELAKRRGIKDLEAQLSYANSFTLRTMGNYNPLQRPVMFQGTIGAAIGIFQTFILTQMQNLFRYTEARQGAALATYLVAQSGMFGIESLPFYNILNESIGAYLSDDHTDIRTVAYKLFGDESDQSRSAAEYVLYGMPSTLLQAGLYSRAAIDPRLPFNATDGIGIMPASASVIVDLFRTAEDMVTNVGAAIEAGSGWEGVKSGLLRALSVQHLSRPIARFSEVLEGKSFDRAGRILTTDEEDDLLSIARILSTRPLKEQVVRTLRYQGSYYNKIDNARQDAVREELRTYIANGGEDPEVLERLKGLYIANGGTERGWTRFLNNAIAEYEEGYISKFADIVKKQENYSHIIRSYGGL